MLLTAWPDVQVLADPVAETGYSTELTPLRDGPTWRWEYTLQDDGTFKLAVAETAAAAPNVTDEGPEMAAAASPAVAAKQP